MNTVKARIRRYAVTPEQASRARRVTVLEYMAKFEPEELVKVSAHDFRTKTHSSLVISDNGLFHWYRAGVGGNNAIDYLCKVRGMDFPSAVRLLNEMCGDITPAFQPVKPSLPVENKEKAFCCPVPDRGAEAVVAYLKRRCIHSAVIEQCQRDRNLYQTTRGFYKNCVFVGRDEQGDARSAFVRSCQGTWRGDSSGSQKKYGFRITPVYHKCGVVEVYEAPIDLMSGASLRCMQDRAHWRSVEYLALGGLSTLALDHFLQANPHVQTIRLCVDNDPPGRDFVARAEKKYTDLGYRVEDCPPQIGKDYNDLLIQTCRQSRVNPTGKKEAVR